MFKYARPPPSLGTGKYHFETEGARLKAPSDRDQIYLFDYATLKLIWWAFIDPARRLRHHGRMDLGIGTLLPFVGRTDDEQQVMLNSVGPHWEGNQVWFITAGGAHLRPGRSSTPPRSPAFTSR